MFEEYLLKNLPNKSDSVLPDMIRVGSFRHKHADIPVFLPFSDSKGFCFFTQRDEDKAVIVQMQYMALELMKFVDPHLLQFKFVDVGLVSRYSYLSSIKSSNITFINNHQSLNKELDQIVDRARYVSSQCLGYQYADIEAYNSAHPDCREPYTILFISCFPKDFDDRMLLKLSMIMREGKNCGIRIIMNMSFDGWNQNSYLSEEKKTIYHDVWNMLLPIDCRNPKNALHRTGIEIYNRFSQKYDFIFDNYSASDISVVVNSLNAQTSSNDGLEDFLSIPIGKNGKNVINLEMGLKSGVYHGFIAGQSGSGKTNLLHNIITSIANSYSPDELRLYLLDYKWGVEFQVYENHPNVECVLLDNENIDAGISLLKDLRKEFISRSREFCAMGKTINNIDEYNRRASKKMPHILVIIDEVQQLFSTYSQKREVGPILREIAKQGRAFGVHLLLSSQTYAQCDIDGDTLSQMPLRIAFALASGMDCRSILGPDNDAPLTLPPYTAIYNTRNGARQFNALVKVDYFDKGDIEEVLSRASRKYKGCRPFKKRILRGGKIAFGKEAYEFIGETKVVCRPEYSDVDFEKEFGF